jgi:hypothetical protein
MRRVCREENSTHPLFSRFGQSLGMLWKFERALHSVRCCTPARMLAFSSGAAPAAAGSAGGRGAAAPELRAVAKPLAMLAEGATPLKMRRRATLASVKVLVATPRALASVGGGMAAGQPRTPKN